MDVTQLTEQIKQQFIDVDFSTYISEVDYLKARPECKPTFIVSPIIEIYWERAFSDGGDYDRVVMDYNGEWHWEHNEHYPEYYMALHWRENYPECMDWYYNNPPHDYLGWMSDDCPDYGKHVNSLCWSRRYSSFHELLSKNKWAINESAFVAHINVCDETYAWGHFRAFVNPKFKKFSLRPSIECCLATQDKNPTIENYIHWLSLGFTESEPALEVFYPIEPKG